MTALVHPPARRPAARPDPAQRAAWQLAIWRAVAAPRHHRYALWGAARDAGMGPAARPLLDLADEAPTCHCAAPRRRALLPN